MPTYIYKGKTQQGGVSRGKIEADNKPKALDSLQSQGLIILSLKESEDLLRVKKTRIKKRLRLRLKVDDLASMARQLATLLDAGVPLLRSLEIVGSQAEVKSLYLTLERIMKDIEGGEGDYESIIAFLSDESINRIFVTAENLIGE